MKKIGEIGWIEKEEPFCGPMDALVKPLALYHLALQMYILFGKVLLVIEKI